MQTVYTEDKIFDKNDFTKLPLSKGEYENCTFKHCNFTENDLSDFKFMDCEFIGCNLSLAKMHRAALQGIKFKDCKMLGLRFDTCADFNLSFSFDNCTLNHSSFYKIKIKKTVFKNSQLQETDFTECDVTGSLFDNCDLTNATFAFTILEKADLRTSYNYSIDPEKNRVKKARFSLQGVTGLLDKYDIEIEAS
jgi:fluoroquinolone resistance protein